ncbi:glycoside hydrolase family 65 [Paenibacillus sp. J5C_2022]|nr:glycoside hydrolase family 65 [Paenibacillus sp. J5C2022]
MKSVNPLSPLSVGNGEFAFTADFTGLQSNPQAYKVALGTQSQWGWHSSGGRNLHRFDDLKLTQADTYGRNVGYPIDESGQEKKFHWLRQNPHRVHLGQIGFGFLDECGQEVPLENLKPYEQVLNLWNGMLTSRFYVDKEAVTVYTCCHPHQDQIAVRVESSLMASERLNVRIAFPASMETAEAWPDGIALVWDFDEEHETTLRLREDGALFERKMDDDGYRMVMECVESGFHQSGPHRFTMVPRDRSESLEFVFGFCPLQNELNLVSYEETAKASASHWERFWMSGGAVDFQECRDSRAIELERRTVLSQFLTAVHCAGGNPPQETGLLYNSWYGKFHLEMHWWHAAHFSLWGRTPLLRKSMEWYRSTLPVARELARKQGYRGARWPKMVDPSGVQSPSTIGTMLIWQQPHILVFAELCYQAEPTIETLSYFRDVVGETAEFMASFLHYEQQRNRYILGPPLIPAQETHHFESVCNPVFELEYWRYGLQIAQQWRMRLGLGKNREWERIGLQLSQLPTADGVYMAHERCVDTYTVHNHDHPSMLGAFGMLPGEKVDPETMRRTLHKVIKDWRWETTWGWDYPMAAMTAARLGERNLAVDMLLMNTVKNTYLPNGHNYQSPTLSAYLPGNGGLLSAVALMTRGWRGENFRHAPGFPDDGSWTVKQEGLSCLY